MAVATRPPAAPSACRVCAFSIAASSGMAMKQRQPTARATSDRLMPVLPAVASVMRPPGAASRPSAIASATISSATRSFTLPPGLRSSALARI
jgi:hypothetical protein